MGRFPKTYSIYFLANSPLISPAIPITRLFFVIDFLKLFKISDLFIFDSESKFPFTVFPNLLFMKKSR